MRLNKHNIKEVKERNKKLIDRYKRGFSMRECAKLFTISVERVRQILREHSPDLIRPKYDTTNNSTGLHSRSEARHDN